MNLKNFSEKEIEKAIKRMTIELVKYKFLGSKTDVASQEQGSTSQHMDYMKEAYETIRGFQDINYQAVVTGKSVQ